VPWLCGGRHDMEYAWARRESAPLPSYSSMLGFLVLVLGRDEIDQPANPAAREGPSGVEQGFVVGKPGFRLCKLLRRNAHPDDLGHSHLVERSESVDDVLPSNAGHGSPPSCRCLTAHLNKRPLDKAGSRGRVLLGPNLLG